MPAALMRSPRSGERVQLLLELDLWHGADDLVGDLALLDEENRWDRPDAVASGQSRVLVHVHLGQRDRAAGLARQLLENRRDGPAGTAPLRPEVHHHDSLVCDQGFVEVLLCQVDRSISHSGFSPIKKSTLTLTWRLLPRKPRPAWPWNPCHIDMASCYSQAAHGIRAGSRSRRRTLYPPAPQGSIDALGLSSHDREQRARGARCTAHGCLPRRHDGHPSARHERNRPPARDQEARRNNRGRRDDGISGDLVGGGGVEGRRLRLPVETSDARRDSPSDAADDGAPLPAWRGAVA